MQLFILKTKELTIQQIKDALRANNCTSVDFDEVKLAANTVNVIEIPQYLSQDNLHKCILEDTL